MKKYSSKYRCSLVRGAAAFCITFLLLAWTGCKRGENTGTQGEQPTTTTEVTTCTSTTSSTTTTTTETTTTSTAATSLRIETTVPMTETAVSIETPVYEESEYETILLARLINKEASATYEGKLAVGSVVLNRMNYYGQSMTEVIYAPNQFTTCYSLGYYTDVDYQAAVEVLTYGSINNAIFFNGCHPDCKNWFYDINYNYLGAW